MLNPAFCSSVGLFVNLTVKVGVAVQGELQALQQEQSARSIV
jgi:hypothetical protein